MKERLKPIFSSMMACHLFKGQNLPFDLPSKPSAVSKPPNFKEIQKLPTLLKNKQAVSIVEGDSLYYLPNQQQLRVNHEFYQLSTLKIIDTTISHVATGGFWGFTHPTIVRRIGIAPSHKRVSRINRYLPYRFLSIGLVAAEKVVKIPSV